MTFIDYLIEKVKEVSGEKPILGIFGSSDVVAIIPMAGNFDDRALDGSKIRVFAFQVLTKNKKQQEAFLTTENLVNGLDGLSNEPFVGGYLIKMECTTTTNFVEKDSDKNYLYTALFRAELGG
ncbi:hypothetical protein [Streptococcus equi]|uniref:hypothetical protein n=1 Tax=Streptococcus equi TaxID=1336 RepID=UPI000657EF3D|nr:hypothetical protein [Streptococcus equi]MBT1201698.1 hypothetical protein [Streptococcus equi subsp. equi]MBT1208669.1 hypothetical protein [Streptococcus equi subsp. equi]MBT1212106.1 hypothetical protein [Streptococcus equi subsp. equi]MBT1216888.1 hypothetical protein [Streptococcus equi subsp. equi]MCD3385058.1 hypothetical protein [Streptococcus equi subsp. zooepidemicus]